MKQPENLHLDIRSVPSLETAIDRWLAARKNAKAIPTDENQHAYNARLFELGAAWAERYPEAAEMPGGFEVFRRGLISPEEEQSG